VDGGNTATYTYDALNQRVRIDAPGSDSKEFVFNANGQRVSIWDANTQAQLQGQAYWGSTPIEFYANGAAHFQHQDWLGTERIRTTYNGSVEGSFISMPYGDDYTSSGSDNDAYHFAQLDTDVGDNSHAQFREYSQTSGRWMSPDPYAGSYTLWNPQSMNRYAYVMSNPLGYVDPTGWDYQYDPVDGCFDYWDPTTNTLTGCIGSSPDTGGPSVSGGAPGAGGGGGSSAAPSNSTQIQRVSGCVGQALGRLCTSSRRTWRLHKVEG
jgi:RHS repeat-associated protein